MKQALFFNFTDKPFVGYWNGKAYTFQPGQKKYFSEGIAKHFAKHLTNQVLIEAGKETSTSPKFPEQVPEFWKIFVKAFIVEDNQEVDPETEIASDQPSMNINVKPTRTIDPFDSHSQPSVGPGNQPTVIGAAEDDEAEYESGK